MQSTNVWYTLVGWVWIRCHVTIISLSVAVFVQPNNGPSTSQPQTNDLHSRLGASLSRLLPDFTLNLTSPTCTELLKSCGVVMFGNAIL